MKFQFQFIHYQLNYVGQRIEDILENGQNKENFTLSPGEKLLVLSNLWSIAAESN